MPANHVLPIEATCADDLPGKDAGDFTYGHTPADIAKDNYRRATFAAVAVEAYASATGVAHGEEVGLAIADLLGDLQHLIDCLRAGAEDADNLTYPLDFDALVERGRDHYVPETTGNL